MKFREITRAFFLIQYNTTMQDSLKGRLTIFSCVGLVLALTAYTQYQVNCRLPDCRN